MGISAFLSLRMAKEKEKAKLRPVDEEGESRRRYIRLGKDAAEEREELPPVRVGTGRPLGRLDAAMREELKIRSSDPGVDSLIEKDILVEEEPWEATQASSGIPWGWVALVGCAFVAAIIWSLVSVKGAEGQRKDLTESALAVLENEEREEMEAVALIDTLERVAREFLDARTVDEMLVHVRHPDRVAPLMENHYAGRGPTPSRVLNVISLDPLTIEKRASFWMLSCELEDGKSTQMLLEAVSGMEAKVDWETYVCYQPMKWDDFASERPGGYTADFRVYVEKDHFYSHEFADSQAYACYRLTALNGEAVLFGYVPRGAAFAEQISELAGGQRSGPAPMILRLHVPEGIDSPRGVQVRELVSPRWAFVENPAEQER